MASPVLTARNTAHLSLVIAAPLPLFLWALLRTLDSRRIRDAVLVGRLVALATYSRRVLRDLLRAHGRVPGRRGASCLRWPARPRAAARHASDQPVGRRALGLVVVAR